jgi:hypothetical protein
VVQLDQLSKCASHTHVLSRLGIREKEGLMEEFYSDPFELNEEQALGDFLVRRLSEARNSLSFFLNSNLSTRNPVR